MQAEKTPERQGNLEEHGKHNEHYLSPDRCLIVSLKEPREKATLDKKGRA